MIWPKNESKNYTSNGTHEDTATSILHNQFQLSPIKNSWILVDIRHCNFHGRFCNLTNDWIESENCSNIYNSRLFLAVDKTIKKEEEEKTELHGWS